MVCGWIKAPLACAQYEELFYTAGHVPQNGAGDLADRKALDFHAIKPE